MDLCLSMEPDIDKLRAYLTDNVANRLRPSYRTTVTGWIIEVDGEVFHPVGAPYPPVWKTEKSAYKALDRHIDRKSEVHFYTEYYLDSQQYKLNHPSRATALALVEEHFTTDKIINMLLDAKRLVIKYVKDQQINYVN